ncbi:MAG TPA: hypothetical protein VJW93_07840 [Candidatus Acidoferrales bacterium]|nr:hypothetical protein [Candidatus Acidoferrales bacterium]
MICTIALGVGFVAEAAAHGSMVALVMFGLWGLLSIALLYLLFRRGKNSLAFALGLGAAPAFIALLALICLGLSRLSEVFRHLLFIVLMFGGGLPPFPDMMMREDSPQLATLGTLLLWLFGISSAVLVLSSIAAFQEMVHEAKGMGKLRSAFWAGICCAPVVWLIIMLLRLSLGGGFGM